MVSYEQAVEVIRDNIDRDSRLPDRMSYIIHEADQEGQHANVSLPLIEMQIANVSRDDRNNTTKRGFVFDTDGNRVGRLFESKWEMELYLNIWTVDGSDYNVDELASVVKTVLFDHDELGPDEPFTMDGGEPVDDIWGFRLGDSERTDEFGQTPSVRRLRLTATVRGLEEYRQTGEDPILETEQNVDTQ
jgi:hypothetical protein